MTQEKSNNKRADLVKIWKLVASSAVELLAFPWLPWEKREREEYLSKAREKVEFYKPKIEEKTGVSLGDVKVRDWNLSLESIIENYTINSIAIDMYNKGRPLKIYELDKIVRECLIEGVKYYALRRIIPSRGGKFVKRNNTIYFKTGPFSRTASTIRGKMDYTLDEDVVHELSHGLWEKLRAEMISGGREGYLTWSEGFATFCAHDYFSEFYPKNAIRSPVCYSGSIYRVGYQIIRQMINKYGEGILLKIPRLVDHII